MRRTRVALFTHLIWATWDRAPVLVGEVERQVYRAIEASCVELGAEVVAIGGVEDHIHLLVRMPATLTVADLTRRVKGASAHLVTHVVAPNIFFKWQGGYAAFSVSLGYLEVVREYILHQKEHHHLGSLIAEWEGDDEEGEQAGAS